MLRAVEEINEDLLRAAERKDVESVSKLCEELRSDHEATRAGLYSGGLDADDVINDVYRKMLKRVWGDSNKEFDPIINELANHGADIEVARKVMYEVEKISFIARAIKAFVWYIDVMIGRHKEKANAALSNLMFTDEHVRPEKIKLLVKDGASLNNVGRLMTMTTLGKVDLMRSFIEAGAKVNSRNQKGRTPLIRAVIEGKEKIIRLLIEKGADLNAKDYDDGRTALIHAALEGNTEVIRLLVEAGADLNAKDSDGRTALIYAVRKGNIEAIKELIDKGVNVHAQDDYSINALMHAARKGNIEAMKELMDGGADINARNTLGETALMYAAIEGNVEAMRFLIEVGANLDAKDIADGAALGGKTEVMQMLILTGSELDLSDYHYVDGVNLTDPNMYAILKDCKYKFTAEQIAEIDENFRRNSAAKKIIALEGALHSSKLEEPEKRAETIFEHLKASKYAKNCLSYQMLRYRDAKSVEELEIFRKAVLEGISGWANAEKVKAAVEESARAANTMIMLRGIEPSWEIGLDVDLLYRKGGMEAIEACNHPDAKRVRDAKLPLSDRLDKGESVAKAFRSRRQAERSAGGGGRGGGE